MEKRKAKEFGDVYIFTHDSSDIADTVSFCNTENMREMFGGPEEITGAFLLPSDADIDEIWLTDAAAPWSTDAVYTKMEMSI